MILIYHFLFCRSYSWIRGRDKLGNTELTCSLGEDAVGQLRAEPSVGKLDSTATCVTPEHKLIMTHFSKWGIKSYSLQYVVKARKMTLQRSDHVSLVLLILKDLNCQQILDLDPCEMGGLRFYTTHFGGVPKTWSWYLIVITHCTKKVIYLIDIHISIELRVKRWIYQMPNCQGAVEGYEYQILRTNNNQCGFRWLARRMRCECCLFIWCSH